jgi:thiazole/oxazole-forming peptide maturase SagC family component
MKAYELAEGTSVLSLSPVEIRLRKGIWNHTEAVLKLSNLPDPVVRFLRSAAEALRQFRKFEFEQVSKESLLSAAQTEALIGLLDELTTQGFLVAPEIDWRTHLIKTILGGDPLGTSRAVKILRPILFVGDGGGTNEAARMLAQACSIPLDVIETDVYRALVNEDLTRKLDAVLYEQRLEKICRQVERYACIAVAQAIPNISLLRNLNEVLLRTDKPSVIGLVDGPFLSIVGTSSPHTGCFGCFEMRQLSRLEDTAAYQDFVRAQSKETSTSSWNLAAHILTSAVMMESLLLASTGLSRLVGRALHVYLPTLEIQVEDLLRVPFCPACGHVAKSQMREIYTSSRALMDKLLSTIEIRSEI